MRQSSPTVISLFAGCGGSSLGYQMAGYHELLAVEWDQNAVKTFRTNFPGVSVYPSDIGKLTVKECLRLAYIEPGELDVLDGSPPCQGFSMAGKRKFGDDRNQLFHEYVRLLKGLQPKVFVMENVSGMVKGKMKLIFAKIMRELKAAGYQVRCKLLNAKHYGVPQNRQRIIFIGTRYNLNIRPSYPKGSRQIVTVRQAIGHLPIGEPGKHQPQVIEAWKQSKPGQSLRKAVRYVGSFQSVRLDPDKPSTTQIKAHLNWYWLVPRHLTCLEAAILGGYPSSYRWIGGKNDWREGIGNSVPPKMMQAIAEHIKAILPENGLAFSV